ncbi:LOW QUALITY PROTEIN: zf-CCHC domain-containing protein/UBN2 domain-containing protein, partial [Cephalotus follicularis]
YEYELFLMRDDECISDMFTRFTTIINSLKNLGKPYPNQELVRKILRCLPKSQKGKKVFKKKFPQDEVSSKKEEPTCYECKKPGHLKNECPNLKNKELFKKSKDHSKKKKGFVAIWDDSDSLTSEESDEQVANVAFMAIEEEEEDEVIFSFDELQDAYENLFHEYKNICSKNKSLKKDAISMSNE